MKRSESAALEGTALNDDPQQTPTGQETRQEDHQHALKLSYQERDCLANLFADQTAHNPHQRHTLEFFLTLKMLAHFVPERVLYEMLRFRSIPTAYPQGYMVLRNLPCDAARITPRTHACPVRDATTLAERVCLLIASVLGDPFALGNEQNGRLPNAIIAVEGKETDRSSASSKATLGWHVDNIASLTACAAWLCLYCIKPDQKGEGATTIASIYEALPLLCEASLRILRQPIFKVTAPAAFSGKAEPVIVPIIGGSENLPWLSYRSYGLEPVDPENIVAHHALCELEEALNSVARYIYLRSGDMLILRNGFTPLNVVHGRSTYEAHFDHRHVANRYLVRAYVHRDITQILPYLYPNSHVIVPTELHRAAFPEL